MGTPPVLKLANEIAVQFRHYPPHAAAIAIANHMRMFWDPRMHAQLKSQVAADGVGCDPNVVAAVELLSASER
ncbi:formate dehydrogenase subunit delta [Saccharopolyspora sp. NPDC002376]